MSETLTVADVAVRRKLSRASITRLVDHEGLPAYCDLVGPKGRRTLRFDSDEVDRWFTCRRAAQLNNWSRYQRRGQA